MSSPSPSSPPPPSNGTLPVPPSPSGLTTGVLIVLIVGIVAGVALVLVCMGGGYLYYRRRKRRLTKTKKNKESSLLPTQDSKGDAPLQHWQQNAPLPNPIVAPAGFLSPGKLGFTKPLQSPSPGICTFTYEELEAATDGFSNANILGQGGFGFVHKGVLSNGEFVAIKQLKVDSKQGEREFQAEVATISRIHHRNLVTLIGYCMTEDRRMLVYEFVPNKTLEFHLHGKQGTPVMSWTTRMKIALGSARGLAYLHEGCQPKIIHRDIKATNILLDSNFEAKVADFGLARFFSDAETHVSTRVMGTFGYLAPEYAASGWLNDRSDVFSFGVVLLELITGHRPVHRIEDDSMIDWVKPLLTKALEDGNFEAFADPRLEKNYNSSEMAQMVTCAAACVRHSARRRPRMGQIVRALEGNISLDDLSEGLRPGDSAIYCSYASSDSDSLHNEEMTFQKMAVESQEQAAAHLSLLRNDYNNHESESGSESQQTTQEIEIEEMKKRNRDIPIGR